MPAKDAFQKHLPINETNSSFVQTREFIETWIDCVVVDSFFVSLIDSRSIGSFHRKILSRRFIRSVHIDHISTFQDITYVDLIECWAQRWYELMCIVHWTVRIFSLFISSNLFYIFSFSFSSFRFLVFDTNKNVLPFFLRNSMSAFIRQSKSAWDISSYYISNIIISLKNRILFFVYGNE